MYQSEIHHFSLKHLIHWPCSFINSSHSLLNNLLEHLWNAFRVFVCMVWLFSCTSCDPAIFTSSLTKYFKRKYISPWILYTWYVNYQFCIFVLSIILIMSFCSDYLFKLLLIGDSGVGKSCLLLRFAVSRKNYHSLYSFQIRYWSLYVFIKYLNAARRGFSTVCCNTLFLD